MKKLLVTAVSLGVIGFATNSFAVISGTSHDITAGGFVGTNPGGPCAYCHTPHTAYLAGVGLNAPLWDHNETGASFTMYADTFGTMEATVADGPMPAGVSKACLSCHDGTVAIDAVHTTNPNPGNVLAAPAVTYIGTDLTDDHPVSISLSNAILTDNELQQPAAATGVVVFGATDLVECGSCHDVHGVTGVSKFLVADNSASAICLACHIK